MHNYIDSKRFRVVSNENVPAGKSRLLSTSATTVVA